MLKQYLVNEVTYLRISDIEFINIENANTTGVGSTLVSNDTLVFFNLHGIKDHELEEILNYKSFTYRSWKEGKKTIYFVFKYGYGLDSKVIYCSAGFSSILIRLLQNKYGYTINGKELYRAKEITRLPNMKFSLWDFQRDAIQEWINNGCYGILACPTASGKSIIGCSVIKKMNVRTIILCHTADLLINVWFNYLVEQFGEEIKDRIGIIGGGLTNKDRKMMRIIDNDFYNNIKKDIVVCTSQALIAGNKLPELGKEHFGLMITDECLPYDTIINTSKGTFKIGELYDIYNNESNRYLVERMKVSSLDLRKKEIIECNFVPKKTVIKQMYEIELINGITFKASNDHMCLTYYRGYDVIDYDEIKYITNIGRLNSETKQIEFIDIVDKRYIGKEQGYDLEVLNDNHNYFIENGVNVHNCHHYSAEQFKKVSSAIRSAYRLGLSATIHRPDGLSPIFYALLGDVRYRIGIKELVKKGLLVEPIFYSIIIEDEEACNKIRICPYKLLEYSRYVKKVSGSSELKFRYILGLCQSLQSKGRKFMLYTDFVNKNKAIDEDGEYLTNDLGVFTRDDYVKGLLELKIKTIGVSSEMSGIQRQSIFNKLGNNELDGIVFGSLGNEGINIPAVDSIIMCNATASTIRFPQRCGRAMRLYKGKTNCYIYEILLNTPKELQWSQDNFLEYEEQGFNKERIYVNNDGYLIKKEIKLQQT